MAIVELAWPDRGGTAASAVVGPAPAEPNEIAAAAPVVRLGIPPTATVPSGCAPVGPPAGAEPAERASGPPARAVAVRWRIVPTAADVLEVTRCCAAVGVDIPLGLPAGGEPRECDVLVTRRLGRARSSVFPAPPRAVLAAATHTEACAVARRLTGRAISVQTFHIGPKILEWDRLARPAGVVEVHPELALRSLAPDTAFAPKKTARGAGQRIAALGRWVDAAAALGDLPEGARLDDVLDALAAAWSAARLAGGCAEVIGAERDDRGRPMYVIR